MLCIKGLIWLRGHDLYYFVLRFRLSFQSPGKWSREPGPAIGPFHWKNRRLHTRELCRLQTFPKKLKISGSQSAIQRQLGNAVPSLLAEVIARSIGDQLFDRRPLHESPTLSIPIQGEPPAPEQTAAVVKKYERYLGDHPDHPGTGKGPVAAVRKQAAAG